jgi:tRNA threonylcarbamoyladenosine biosynthesis protein TsaE
LTTNDVVVVEWMERVAEAAPRDYLDVELVVTAQTSRVLRAESRGVKAEQLLERWAG